MSHQNPASNPIPSEDVEKHRREKREAFLKRFFNLDDIEIQPLQADASFRRYYRILNADRPYLLMEDPTDRPPVPPLVMVEPFIKIANHLRDLGLSSPLIFEREISDGLLLIEDWGDATYTRLFADGQRLEPLYELATDALITLHVHPRQCDIDLPLYDADQLMAEAMLLPDWYVAKGLGKTLSQEARTSYENIFRSLFRAIDTSVQTMVLRDYHVDNLIHLSERTGAEACGLLDFQDALIGHPSYDLMSLLEDARRDVPHPLQAALLDRYFTKTGFERERFMTAYRILGVQRHAKVVGIFVRLWQRDGKEKYLDYLPHVQNLLLSSLKDPVLEPLKQWFETHEIDLTKRITA